jgi:histidyl-tRNA synthetase
MDDLREKITAVKGMPDILPEHSPAWQHLEMQIRQLMSNYAYAEIRTPALERTQLFKRSIGEVTDIVEKEMFTFPDQNGDNLTLRPEGTAGCARACIEYSLLRNQQQQKLWYIGSMFRYEKPQKGRYRQFSQLGVEAFNMPGPDIDAEQLSMCSRLWQRLGIDSMLNLQINSLGDSASRNLYKNNLVTYFSDHAAHLDEDSKRRLVTNPMRILDSKNPEMQEMISRAPILTDYLDSESAEHFMGLQQHLVSLGIKFSINPRLVRGLDYYNRTVYEWVSDQLGSQSAVCAGGRYDTLVSQLGGPETPAVGFAVGLERILLLLEVAQQSFAQHVDGYLACIGDKALPQKLVIAEKIRERLPKFNLVSHLGSSTFNSILKKAVKSGAKVMLIVGDEGIFNDTVDIKFLRDDRPQQTVAMDAINTILGDE